jgi:flagellum-specific ATP synthase
MTPDVREGATRLRSLLAAYRDKKDLIAIGAYERGSDPVTDMAIDLKDLIDGFLKQKPDEAVPGPDSDDLLLRTVGITAVSVGDLAASMEADQVAAAMAQPPAQATGPSAIPPLNLAV